MHVLKGRLIIKEQLRQNLAHAERFYVRYQVFSTNRPVNRLLKSTLLLLRQLNGNANNQSLIQQALSRFEDVPGPANVAAYPIRAKVDRTMPLTARLFPWAKLFLERSAPTTYQGRNLAFALLFPMERIFEDYVAHRVRWEMHGWDVRAQERRNYLVERNSKGKPEFQLQPDIVARKDGQATRVMDAKWKRLTENDKHAGISQADLYQLYAYGRKYEAGNKRVPVLFLLYPWNDRFRNPLRFDYGDDLRLEVRPVHLHDENKSVFDSMNRTDAA